VSAERGGGLRASLAVEAARLMYEEGVKQYFTAKRIAAKRVLGRVGGRRLRFRPQDLPSNGEIRDALLRLAELAEGGRRGRRLFAMRVVALEAMRALAPFDPRLIGSVSTGHVRRGSDVDLHVFADDEGALEAHVAALGWTYELERVSIVKAGTPREYTHVHVADVFAVELTVYARRERFARPRSSTDGKPIERLDPAALEALMARDHPEAWARYVADGTVAGMEDWLEADDDGPPPGPFDGLLLDGPGPPLPPPDWYDDGDDGEPDDDGEDDDEPDDDGEDDEPDDDGEDDDEPDDDGEDDEPDDDGEDDDGAGRRRARPLGAVGRGGALGQQCGHVRLAPVRQDSKLAAVRPHELARDVKPEAEPPVALGASALGRAERVEEGGHELGPDRPGVLDLEGAGVGPALDRDDDGRLARAVAQGVADEVRGHAGEGGAVPAAGGVAARLDDERARGVRRLQLADDRADHFARVDVVELDGEAHALAGAGHVEQVVDDVAQALAARADVPGQPARRLVARAADQLRPHQDRVERAAQVVPDDRDERFVPP
jgi:hypothetical protein